MNDAPGKKFTLYTLFPPASGLRSILVCIVWTIAVGFALLTTINNFLQHFTPDASIYILHARTLLETGQRYLVSHDSKGPVLVWFYALPVWLFGATVVAAAFLQTLLHAGFAVHLARFLRQYCGAGVSTLTALIAYSVVSAPALWGSGMRTEDALLLIVTLLFFSFQRVTVPWRILAGMLTALACGMKISYAFSLLLCCMAGILVLEWRSSGSLRMWTPRIRSALLWYGLGFVATALGIVAIIALTDSLEDAVKQTVLWPLRYRTGSGFGPSPVHPASVLWHSGLAPLAMAILVYLLLLVRKREWAAVPLLVFFVAEMMRIGFEGTRWSYLAIPLVPVLIITPFLSKRYIPHAHTSLALLVLFLLPLLLPQLRDEIIAFDIRALHRQLAPYEELARRMKIDYKPGETLFINSNDYQLHLLLGAPPPWPILPYHYQYVSVAEQHAFRQYYEKNPPTWIVTRDTVAGSTVRLTRGSIDGAYYVFTHPPESRHEQSTRDARTLLDDAVVRGTYRCTTDIGWAQAWKRVE